MNRLATTALVFGWLLLLAGSAQGAPIPYDVYACSLPNGARVATDGWSAFSRSLEAVTENTCPTGAKPTGRYLAGTFFKPPFNYEYSGWQFAAPPDTTAVNATLYRAVRTAPGAGFEAWEFGQDQPVASPGEGIFEQCAPWETWCNGLGTFSDAFAAGNRVDYRGFSARRLSGVVRCYDMGNPHCTPNDLPALLRIFSARVGLLDEVSPQIDPALQGSLLSGDPWIAGERTLTLTATDRGGGIASIGLLADGSVVLRQAASPADTRCHVPFTTVVPCPLSARRTISFDTSALANGSHVMQAFAEDVSGNRGASAPFTITTRNGSIPNGRGATRFARLSVAFSTRQGRRATKRVRYGSGATLHGRLTARGGRPIGRASIELKVRTLRPGAVARRTRRVTTDARGRFAYRLRAGASRTIGLGYRAYTLDEGYAARAKVRLLVRAGVALKVRPHAVRNGASIRFVGRLKGGPNRRDASIILYALAGRGRIPVASLRANKRGRFEYRYRFRTVQRPTTFRFVAQVERRAGYPYAAGASRRVRVVVRP